MILPLRRYADFSGRSRRKEFWMFFLFQFVILIGLPVLVTIYIWVSANNLNPVGKTGGLGFLLIPIFWMLLIVATIIPNLALIVRRFHDQDLPAVLGILLYIGTILFILPGIAILIFMCIEGKKGDNQYGGDPKMVENVGDTFR